MLKLFEVLLNDRDYHEVRILKIAENEAMAIEQVKNNRAYYKNWDVCAVEITVDGYDIAITRKED